MTRLALLATATAVVASVAAAPLAAAAPAAVSARPHPYALGPGAPMSANAAAAAAPAATAAPSGSFTNGGFETGDLTGYTSDEMYSSQGSGGINPEYAYQGTESNSQYMIPAPASGTYAGILDDGASGMGSEVLYQDVTVPAAGATLSLNYAYQSFAPLASPATLDYTTTAANQQFRIDVIKPSANTRSVAASDILATVFATQTGGTAMLPSYAAASTSLKAFAGQTVRLRMAIADNQDSMLAEVDNITLTSNAPAAALPEVSEVILFPVIGLVALGGLELARRRRWMEELD